MLRIPATLAMLALLAPAAVALKKTPAPKKDGTLPDLLTFPATEKLLPNGLKVIVVPTGFPNIVSLQIPVQTGSRNEVEPGKSGFAHFFEHMMFRGTKAYPPERYQDILTQVGARQNAYTTDDFTNYHTTFAKDDLETDARRSRRDRFQNLVTTPRRPSRPRRAPCSASTTRTAPNPIVKLVEVQRDHAFTTHTYKHTTMGFIKDIEDMPNQFAYSRRSSSAGTGPNTRRSSSPATSTRRRSSRSSRSTGATGSRGPPRRRSRRSPRRRVPSTPTWRGRRRPCPGSRVAFHGPAFSGREEGLRRDRHPVRPQSSARRPTSTRSSSRREQKVDQLFADSGGNQDPSLVDRLRARQEDR